MTGVRFADVELRPAEFLNLTSLTLEEFEGHCHGNSGAP
jgi:hypothetical protein